MPIYTYSYIQDRALDLIDEQKINEPPVDVREIAGRMGIEIMEMSADTWFYGMLTRYNDDLYIVVNKMMPETKKRFTIAHELGHYRLHYHDMAYQRRPDKEHYHREADAFAVELCIPTPLIKREAYKWYNDHRYLANLFGVSEPLMIKKMEELNLIPKGKFNWVYAESSAV